MLGPGAESSGGGRSTAFYSGAFCLIEFGVKNRNIVLGYVLIALNNALFWFAPWLLFVYRYLDVRQATLLQLIALIVKLFSEIPTGVLGDLLGKKKTLILAFVFGCLGNVFMSISSTFISFAIVYVLIALGSSFYSGTIDAFMYDSLVENKQEKQYKKVLGRSHACQNLATALATLMGGFLFKLWGGLPFLVTGICQLIALVLVLWTHEPKVDTFVFSVDNFLRQTVKGVKHLFSSKLSRIVWLLLLAGSFTVVAYEILDDVAVIEWGYDATGISILYTVTMVLTVPLSLNYDKISRKINPEILIILETVLLGLNYVFGKKISLVLWSVLFLVRVVTWVIQKMAVTEIINESVSSKIRTTTLSSYELLINIPFMLFGVVIGDYLKLLGGIGFGLYFSVILLILLSIYVLINLTKKKGLYKIEHSLRC